MFDSLAGRFDEIFTRLRRRGRLTEKDVDEFAREIRVALLEADVNLVVAKQLITRVKDRAHGAEVLQSLTPAQQVVKVVHEELVTTLGATTAKLTMSSKPPTIVMLAGLQGSGKTTVAGKLARHLKKQGLQVLLVGADRQRPAAVDQLRTLGKSLDVPVFSESDDPVAIASVTRDEAARLGKNVVIVDTAGRLHVDEQLMDELRRVRDELQPDDSLLVVDAMTGQEAVNVATSFSDAVGLDGIVLTKIDGDARGGAALSVKEVVGKPILYVGTGEKLDDFEAFHPDRMASRILGMGDVLTLIEKAEERYDADEARRAEEKLRTGTFGLQDFLDQMRQLRKMGPLQSLVGMLPGVPKELKNAELDEGELVRIEAIICSMTPDERDDPSRINGPRRLRIARGSGTTTADVNALLKQFKTVRQMVQQMAGGKGRKGRGSRGMELPIPGR